MFIYGVQDDQRWVPGNLQLGVSHRRSMVHHHHNVFGLGADRGHIDRPTETHPRTRRNTHTRQDETLKQPYMHKQFKIILTHSWHSANTISLERSRAEQTKGPHTAYRLDLCTGETPKRNIPWARVNVYGQQNHDSATASLTSNHKSLSLCQYLSVSFSCSCHPSFLPRCFWRPLSPSPPITHPALLLAEVPHSSQPILSHF